MKTNKLNKTQKYLLMMKPVFNETSLVQVIDKPIIYENEHIKIISVNTISTSLGPKTHNITTNPPIPSKVISPWTNVVN
jgi:hypothetical protein